MRDGRGPRPAARGARRRARPRAAGRPRRRRPGHAARAGRAPRFVPPAARRRRGADRARRLDAARRRPGRGAGATRWTSSICSPISPPSSAPRLEERPPADARRRRRDPARATTRELDELRALRDGGRQYIASLQQRERERTGIPSLKVGFNKVFGYYLEITNAHARPGARRLRAAADAGLRRALRHARAQGLRGAGPRRRGADGRARGGAVRRAARRRWRQAIDRVQRTARVLARLDVWAALADGAVARPLRAARGARRVRPRAARAAATR